MHECKMYMYMCMASEMENLIHLLYALTPLCDSTRQKQKAVLMIPSFYVILQSLKSNK